MTPYADTAARYWEAGWKGVLPLPAGRKKSPPPGYTGYGAPYLSYADVYALCESDGAGNICLRLPADVIGIDVDDYDDKPGAASLAALASVCGPLPATWISTSRAGPSGIRLYRVPPGGSWTGNPAAGIEIIQAAHRYAVVWPSTHPEGRTYRWYDPYGAPTETIPKPDELPELPAAWLAALISGREHAHAIALTYPQAQTWLDACRPGPLCSIVAGVLNRYLERLAHPSGEARHDLAMAGTRALVAFGGEGHRGAKDATGQLGEAFLSAVCDPAAPGATREAGEATKEYLSLLAGAVRLAAAVDGTPRSRCEHDAPAPGTSGTAAGGSDSDSVGLGSPLEEPKRRIVLTWADTIEMDRVTWGWADRMPVGELTLIPGREGVGKSLFLAWLTAALTRGILPGHFFGTPRPVLYVASEDSWRRTVLPRLVAAGADVALVGRIEVEESEGADGRLSLPVDCRALGELAISVQAAAVMLDPIISLIDDKLSVNQARELRQALEPLRRHAERAEIMIGALAHFNKMTDADVLSKIPGSRAWAEVARAAFGIARNDEEDCYVGSQIKNNLGRLDLPHLTYRIESVTLQTPKGITDIGRLAWLGESEVGVEDVLGRRPERGGRDTSVTTKGLVEFIEGRGYPVPLTDIYDQFPGIKQDTIKQTLRRAAERGQVSNPVRGHYGPC